MEAQPWICKGSEEGRRQEPIKCGQIAHVQWLDEKKKAQRRFKREQNMHPLHHFPDDLGSLFSQPLRQRRCALPWCQEHAQCDSGDGWQWSRGNHWRFQCQHERDTWRDKTWDLICSAFRGEGDLKTSRDMNYGFVWAGSWARNRTSKTHRKPWWRVGTSDKWCKNLVFVHYMSKFNARLSSYVCILKYKCINISAHMLQYYVQGRRCLMMRKPSTFSDVVWTPAIIIGINYKRLRSLEYSK